MVTFAFYGAVFLSAFLLFIIQPMLSKALLPDFGGSYLVWGAAMVFFQAVLLAGYVFSHTVQRRLGVMRYARWHWLALLLPFFFFPFQLDEPALLPCAWPLAPAVFRRLFLIISGPFLTLSMTSLILQRWLMVSPLKARTNPYVLYSASNAGSVLALLAYPVVIEPFLSLERQGTLWWAGYTLLVALHAVCYPWRPVAAADATASARLLQGGSPEAHAAPRQHYVTWFMLSLGACAALLAVTNVMTFDVASIPLLWVLPLAVYLLAFVLTFKQTMWFPRWLEAGLNWAAVAAALFYLMMQFRLTVPPALSLLLHLLILFVLCMNGSARLVRTRPAGEEDLTGFYVTLAAGGLCGSILISWIIPLISSTLVEYIIAPVLLLAAVGRTDGGTATHRGRRRTVAVRTVAAASLMLAAVLLPALVPEGRLPVTVLFALAALPAALLLRYAATRPLLAACLLAILVCGAGPLRRLSAGGHQVTALRNYYGIYTVFDRDGLRYLQHGTTQHGRQYLEGEKRNTPLAYYHPSTPAAGIFTAWRPRLHDIAMIGLGTGALTAYTGDGVRFTVYELDPDNLMIADRYFSYLDQSRRQGTALDVVFGDGRISLRKKPDNSLDLLIIDAFNSGSIPAHLITVEAIAEYVRVLRGDGLLLLHISNRVLDLAPVLYANAAALGLTACEQSNERQLDPDADLTLWVAISRHPETITTLKRDLLWYGRHEAEYHNIKPWTDRYSHILGAVRWFH